MNWSALLQDCKSLENVTIVCSDGIIHTHKIIVASASDFIKHLLSEVPVGDEITLYLPDYDKCSVEELLDGIFSALQKEDPFGYHHSLKEDIKEEKEDETKFSNDIELEEELTDDNCVDQFTVINVASNRSKKTRGRYKIKSTNELPDEVNELVENKIKDIEKQMLDHPVDSAINEKLSKQILYEKARAEVIRYSK